MVYATSPATRSGSRVSTSPATGTPPARVGSETPSSRTVARSIIDGFPGTNSPGAGRETILRSLGAGYRSSPAAGHPPNGRPGPGPWFSGDAVQLCRDGDAREQLEPAAVRSPPAQHGLGQADFGGLSGSDRINRPALGADAVGQRPGHRQVAAEHLVPGRGQRPGSIAGSGPSHHRPHVPRCLGGGDRVPAFSLVFGSAHNAHRSGSGRADEQVLPGVPDRTFIDVGAGTGCGGTELGPRSPPPTNPTRQAWSWSPREGPCYRKTVVSWRRHHHRPCHGREVLSPGARTS